MAKLTLRRLAPWLVLAVLLGFVGYKILTVHFDWAGFVQSWRTADFRLIALAIAVILTNYVFRAMRWAVFLRPATRAVGQKPIPWWSLTGSQFVGFAGLVLFGRVGELIRPLLVSRPTGLTLSSQIAVVTVERVFDLGAFALIFSLNLLLAPALRTLPHHELFHAVGYVIVAITVLLWVFVAAIGLAGLAVAAHIRSSIGLISEHAGNSAADKILSFRDGLNVIDNVRDFFLASTLSLAIWFAIGITYVLTLKAFPAPVHALTIADALLLMGFSVVGGIVQLPGVGGGAQALAIGALTQLFGIPAALAISSGLMVWLTSSMCVVPIGLIYARIEGISLWRVTQKLP
jgi:uncharacterized protein (TIRG00374 family)